VNNKRLVVSIAIGVLQALTVALACHSLGWNASGFVLLPLAAGAGCGFYVFKTSGIQ
jgi:predicted exporter